MIDGVFERASYNYNFTSVKRNPDTTTTTNACVRPLSFSSKIGVGKHEQSTYANFSEWKSKMVPSAFEDEYFLHALASTSSSSWGPQQNTPTSSPGCLSLASAKILSQSGRPKCVSCFVSIPETKSLPVCSCTNSWNILSCEGLLATGHPVEVELLDLERARVTNMVAIQATVVLPEITRVAVRNNTSNGIRPVTTNTNVNADVVVTRS
ncbi:hypothetical protein GQ600_13355 [Phytophthora cactorum]|nr:hypothetical protein GQ600_13355 [Phytophthora cactorum]